jgi:hypothetical protein
MCKEHQQMYEEGKSFKAFYGKTVLKKIHPEGPEVVNVKP